MGSKGSNQVKENTSQQYTANPITVQNAGTVSGMLGEAMGQDYSNMPVQPVVGFSPDQESAFAQMRALQGAANPFFQAATNYTDQSAAPISESQIASYFNPNYSRQMAALNDALGAADTRLHGNMVQTAGGDNDRVSVGTAENLRQDQLARGQLAANTWQSAAQMAEQENQRKQAAGALMASYGPAFQNANMQGTGALYNMGSQQQQLAQLLQNSQYDWQKGAFNYPAWLAQFGTGITGGLAGALGGNTQGTKVTDYPEQSPLSQIAGLAAMAAGAYMNPGGALMGAGTKLAGGMGLPSGSATGGLFASGGAVNPFDMGEAFAAGGAGAMPMPAGGAPMPGAMPGGLQSLGGKGSGGGGIPGMGMIGGMLPQSARDQLGSNPMLSQLFGLGQHAAPVAHARPQMPRNPYVPFSEAGLYASGGPAGYDDGGDVSELDQDDPNSPFNQGLLANALPGRGDPPDRNDLFNRGRSLLANASPTPPPRPRPGGVIEGNLSDNPISFPTPGGGGTTSFPGVPRPDVPSIISNGPEGQGRPSLPPGASAYAATGDDDDPTEGTGGAGGAGGLRPPGGAGGPSTGGNAPGQQGGLPPMPSAPPMPGKGPFGENNWSNALLALGAGMATSGGRDARGLPLGGGPLGQLIHGIGAGVHGAMEGGNKLRQQDLQEWKAQVDANKMMHDAWMQHVPYTMETAASKRTHDLETAKQVLEERKLYKDPKDIGFDDEGNPIKGIPDKDSLGDFSPIDPLTGKRRTGAAADEDASEKKANLQGKEYLDSLRPERRAYLNAVLDGRVPPPNPNSRSPRTAALLTQLARAEPDFDLTKWKSRNETRAAFSKGQQGNSVTSHGTAIGHLADMSETIDQLAKHNVKPWNKVENAIKDQLGGTALAEYQAARTAVSEELGKLFQGAGVTTEEAKQRWLQALDDARTPGQFRAVMGRLLKFMDTRMDSLAGQYNRGMLGVGYKEDDPRVLNGQGWLDSKQRAKREKLANWSSFDEVKTIKGVRYGKKGGELFKLDD